MRYKDIQYQLLKTMHGWVAVAYTGRGILALTLPVETPERASEALQRKVASPLTRGRGGYEKLGPDLDRYFRGEAVSFAYPLDVTAATRFQKRVWAVLRGIPYGATKGYREVAKAVGMPGAARAVGQAVGANPIPLLIPCHRVVASDGSLGGFAWGLTWKRQLLQVEGTTPASKT
ncbi:MAG: methylated-DNA--[protein]-cysteine S-methyltransferase [Candidatus Methylomirabilales bacterium]